MPKISIPNPISSSPSIPAIIPSAPVVMSMASSTPPPVISEPNPVSIPVQPPVGSLQTPTPITPLRNNSPPKQVSESSMRQPSAPEIPTIILNNDPSQRPASFQSVRSSVDGKGSDPTEQSSAVPPAVSEENEDQQESEDEISLKDLADNVIYDEKAKRSSIQSIKVFARKSESPTEEAKPKPNVLCN